MADLKAASPILRKQGHGPEIGMRTLSILFRVSIVRMGWIVEHPQIGCCIDEEWIKSVCREAEPQGEA